MFAAKVREVRVRKVRTEDKRSMTREEVDQADFDQSTSLMDEWETESKSAMEKVVGSNSD